jgi:hypothetical protein
MIDLELSAMKTCVGISQITLQAQFGSFHSEMKSFFTDPYVGDLNVFDLTDI